MEEVQTELTFTKYHLEGYTATARSSAQQLTTLKRELRDVQLARDKEVTELKRTVDAKIRYDLRTAAIVIGRSIEALSVYI